MINAFNIRVYGILIQQNKVLLCEEYIRDLKVIKFPGGGLEFGEGLIECLQREFKEELDIEINYIKHFYTTDFFVQSIVRETDQIISIYYLVNYTGEIEIEKHSHDQLKFFWGDLNKLKEDDFYLPVDKVVVERIKNQEPRIKT